MPCQLDKDFVFNPEKYDREREELIANLLSKASRLDDTVPIEGYLEILPNELLRWLIREFDEKISLKKEIEFLIKCC